MLKKLLLINSRFLPVIGGGETYTMEVMEYFSRQGYEVHLITQERGYGKESFGTCYLHFIEGFDDNNINMYLAMKSMRQLLDVIKPDLVHVHNVMPFYVYSSITKQGEYPTILTIHNTPHLPHRLFGGFNNLRTEIAFCRALFADPHCRTVLFGSHYYEDSYLSVIPELRDLSTIVNHYFPPHESIGSSDFNQLEANNNDTDVKILFPSRIIRRKGIEDTLHALGLLPNNYHLFLPGFAHIEEGKYTDHIAHLIRQMGLEKRVIYPHKTVTPADMPYYYKQAHMAVIPSHYEGFGIAAVEAMSWGVPVITTGVGGLSEIIEDTVTGLYTPIADPETLARNILFLQDNKTVNRSIARKAHARVFTDFTQIKHMDRLSDIYSEAIDERN